MDNNTEDIHNIDIKTLTIDQKLELLVQRTANWEDVTIKIDNISTMVSLLDQRTSQIEGRTSALEKRADSFDTNLGDIIKKVDVVETSAKFIAGQYDDLSQSKNDYATEISQLQKTIKRIENENSTLNTRMLVLKNELDQEKQERNREAQYHRTSLNLKLCGVPLQLGEEENSRTPSHPITTKVINKVCEAANISLGNEDIDVCHRLGNDEKSPIIIRFSSISDRFNFYIQAEKLKNILSDDIDFSETNSLAQGTRHVLAGRGRGSIIQTRSQRRVGSLSNDNLSNNKEKDISGSRIYIQEHLTSYKKNPQRD